MRLVGLKCLYLRRLLTGLVKAAVEAAQGLGSGIAAIPGFCNLKSGRRSFIKPNDKIRYYRLSAALIRLMARNLILGSSCAERRRRNVAFRISANFGSRSSLDMG